VALNWVRQQGRDVLPIVGARSATQFAQNLEALTWTLDAAAMAELSAASAIPLGFPHDFLASANIQDLVHAATQSTLDR
jgi:diketogulonate reductase-like aldo/keto reductase